MNKKLLDSYKKIPKCFSEKFLDAYKDEFIYINSDTIMFSKENESITGQFVFKGAQYLKQSDRILNNTEAIIASNQISYLLVMALLATNDGHDIYLDSFQTHLNPYYKKLGNIVLREQSCFYRKPLNDSEGDIILTAAKDNHVLKKNLNMFTYTVRFGKQDNFIITTKAVLLNYDIHAGEIKKGATDMNDLVLPKER